MATTNSTQSQGLVCLLIRIVLGTIMLYYGLQHVFGLMGGDGFLISTEDFAKTFDMPVYVGQIAMIGQLISGVMLLFGFLTRIAAFLVASLMAVGAVIGAKSTETLIKTTSDDPLAAVGYPTALIMLAFVLMFLGAGLASVDSAMAAKRRKVKAAKHS